MRKFVAVAALGLLVVTATEAYADAVAVNSIIKLQLTDVNGVPLDRFGGGGSFRADLAGTADDFLTFCLEINEYFTPGENLNVASITDSAMAGGAGGAVNGADPISGTTAYMYTQFRLGNASFSNGALLQEAIWYKENEVTAASQGALNLITLAETQMQALSWGATDLGGVQVLNLYRGTNYSVRAQDMLTWTRVPEPATLALFALGSCVMFFGRSRRRT